MGEGQWGGIVVDDSGDAPDDAIVTGGGEEEDSSFGGREGDHDGHHGKGDGDTQTDHAELGGAIGGNSAGDANRRAMNRDE
jgi:hypothetical protein